MSAALPAAVQRLIDEFGRLPGIGPKTASRLVFHLLRMPPQQSRDLSEALRELTDSVVYCRRCFNIADASPCAICRDPARDGSTLCVVEEPLDVQAIERTREYKGVYHVLHGAISPVEGVGPEELKIGELLERIRHGDSAGQAADPGADLPVPRTPVQELLLATNPNLEGEATAMYIARLVKPLGIRVTRLARGLPMGGDLEYADEVTLGRALAGRSEM